MWLFFLFFFLSNPALAQDSTPSSSIVVSPTPMPRLFDQYQKDYLFQYDLYQQSYLTYINKKEVYTKYGTITTKKDKFTSAIDAINARNKTLKAYILALRVLMDEYKTTNSTATEKKQIELSKWESWLAEQITIVSAIDNDSDLTKWIDSFKDKYVPIQQAIYTGLVQHEVNLRQHTLNAMQDIGQDIRNNPNIRPESEQWINSLTVKSDLVTTSLDNALAYTIKKQNLNKFSNFYPSAKSETDKANNYLIGISADLKLIVTKFLKQ